MRALAGFSLVQLLVALLLGLIMIVGAMSLYINTTSSATSADVSARLQIAANRALQIIGADAQMANYWGLLNDSAAIINRPGQFNALNPSGNLIEGTHALDCGETFAIDVDRYIDATNDGYNLPDSCAGRVDPQSSADLLTVRRAAISATKPDARRLQLCVNRVQAQIVIGTSCEDEVHNLIVNTYYVSQRSNGDARYPSLRRKELGIDQRGNGPGFRDVELIAGVEDLQVQLGLNSSTSSDTGIRFVDPTADIAPNEKIVAVRIWVLLRAKEAEARYHDTNTYEFANRLKINGTTHNLATDSAGHAYTPDDHFRRLLVSRTFFIRNANDLS